MNDKKDHNLKTLSIVTDDDDSDISFAFRPSVMEHVGVKVVFEETKTTQWSWRKFKHIPAINFNEVWYDHHHCHECDIRTCQEGDRFEPGHSWIELDEDLIAAKLKYK